MWSLPFHLLLLLPMPLLHLLCLLLVALLHLLLLCYVSLILCRFGMLLILLLLHLLVFLLLLLVHLIQLLLVLLIGLSVPPARRLRTVHFRQIVRMHIRCPVRCSFTWPAFLAAPSVPSVIRGLL